MMKHSRLAALSVLALGALAASGCSKKASVEAKNESAESVANKVAKSGLTFQPGRWESKLQIVKMDIPGMPAQTRDMMQKRLSAVQTSFTCLTPEEAAKPKAGFFEPNGSGCKFDNFSMADGKLDAKMTCDRDGHKQTMTMSGTYAEQSYDLTMESKGEVEAGMPASMTMTIHSRRVGECNGNEEK